MWTGSVGGEAGSGAAGGVGPSRRIGLRRVVTFFLAVRGFLAAGRDLRATEARVGLAFARVVFLTRVGRLLLAVRRVAMRTSKRKRSFVSRKRVAGPRSWTQSYRRVSWQASRS
jgi:hypothetical protein